MQFLMIRFAKEIVEWVLEYRVLKIIFQKNITQKISNVYSSSYKKYSKYGIFLLKSIFSLTNPLFQKVVLTSNFIQIQKLVPFLFHFFQKGYKISLKILYIKTQNMMDKDSKVWMDCRTSDVKIL